MASYPALPVSLPSLEQLNVKMPDNVDAGGVAASWLRKFSDALTLSDLDSVLALIIEDGWWRDMLALTWEFRTMHGSSRIRKLLQDRLAVTDITALRLAEDHSRAPHVFTDIPGVIWVQGFFDFNTAVGVGSGIFHLVPTPGGQWKAHVVYTNLESLHGLPPKVGRFRYPFPDSGHWAERRAKEMAFEGSDPTVLVIGAGHSGLEIAARLKYSDVSTLVIEKTARIGDIWRDRYPTLCLHSPVWFSQMPYLDYPSTWPIFAPGHKMADWLESYAHSLELNVWTSTAAESIERDDANEKWVIRLANADGSKRTMRPRYIVMANGFLANHPDVPDLPGMDEFQGQILHSTAYKSAKDFEGKRAIVVGAGTSGHDIAQDLHLGSIDVTMVQRSSTCVSSGKKGIPALLRGVVTHSEDGPPVEVADRLLAAFPTRLAGHIFRLRAADVLREDKELIEGLERVGFKTNMGVNDEGFMSLALSRRGAGGFYINVGASQLIIDGKIKLKRGSVQSFTKDGVVFDDGSTLDADVVVFASGFGEFRVSAAKLLGDELAGKLKPLWGLNDEGEVTSLWRESGLPNLYFMTGNLPLSRFHSAHMALQIQAKEVGLYTAPYLD